MSEGLQKWMPWLLIGALAVGAYLLFSNSSGSGGLATVSQAAPDTSASDQARYGFLSSAIGGLLNIQAEDMKNQAELTGLSLTDQFQLQAIGLQTSAATAAAEAQAKADIAAAKASTVGHRGLSLGPFSITF